MLDNEVEIQDKNTNIDSWQVLIIDKSQEFHDKIKHTLENETYDKINIVFLHAYTTNEAKKILSQNNDIAVAIIDVVIETPVSGLDLIRFIRKKQNNRCLRIILQTDQEKKIPERKIILNYDINDFKIKSELTSKSIFTIVISAIRSYKTYRELCVSAIETQEKSDDLFLAINNLSQIEEKLFKYYIFERTVALCSQRLMGEDESALTDTLQHLLFLSGATRIIIFKNIIDENSGLCMQKKFSESIATFYTPESENKEEKKNEKYAYSQGFNRWQMILSSAEQSLKGNVEDFPEEEQQVLKEDNVISLVALPIIYADHWYGFVRFDYMRKEHIPDNQEVRNFWTIIEMVANYLARKKSAQALRESEQKFRSISSSAQDGIIMIDAEGTINYWNEAAERIFGYNRTEAIGKELHSLLAPERYYAKYKSSFLNINKKDTNDKISGIIELIAIRKDKKEIPIELSLSSVNLQESWNAIGIIRDISERKEKEKMLIEMKTRAEEASEAKSVFLANISHELKTPLNSILGHCDLLTLQQVDSLTEKQLDYVNIIHESSTHLLTIITDLLDISKIEAGKVAISKSKFNFNEIINRLLLSLKPLADEKSLNVEIDIEKSACNISADIIRIKQVIYNLISNAIKFTEKGKSIGIQVKPFEDDKVSLTIWDQGIGISKDNLQKIFEPFEQIVVDQAVKNKGIGLGLPITKKIIELHNGTIKVTSEVNKGSSFEVILPERITN